MHGARWIGKGTAGLIASSPLGVPLSRKLPQQIDRETLASLMSDPKTRPILLDVRLAKYHKIAHIGGTDLNIAKPLFDRALRDEKTRKEIVESKLPDKSAAIVVYCVSAS
jgi:hypothetical protein